MTSTVALIVPLYNDRANVEPFFHRARTVLDSIPEISWRLVFVNDGSTDGSYEQAVALRSVDSRVNVISLSRNFGYHAVLLAGLSSIEADSYAMIDVDCEDPPELLREFHVALESGADIAYGIRSNRTEPWLVTMFRGIFYRVNRLIADSDIVLWMSEFALINREVRDAVIAPRTTYVFLRAEIAYAGFTRVGVPYVRARRAIGRSHYSPFSMTRFAISGFLASSTFPLRFVLYLGALIALMFPVVVIGIRLDATGIAALAAVVALYFLLVALPMLALYLARAYKNGVARPVFIIDQRRTYLD